MGFPSILRHRKTDYFLIRELPIYLSVTLVCLHIDLQKVDYLVLSHGHSDHTGGLRYFMELNTKATIVCKREVFFPKFKDERENGMKHIHSIDLSRFYFIDGQTELVSGVFLLPAVDIINSEDTHFGTILGSEGRWL